MSILLTCKINHCYSALDTKLKKGAIMSSSVVQQDSTAAYGAKEGVIVVGIGWVLAVGGAWLAANLICGWGRVQSISVSWRSVTIVCK
jgi:hypothetical protein